MAQPAPIESTTRGPYIRRAPVKSPVSQVAVLAIVFLGLFAARSEAGVTESRDVVIEWNRAVLANTPASAGVFSFRYQAMVHIAMFDAVNSIQGRYRSYHVRVPSYPTASAEA